MRSPRRPVSPSPTSSLSSATTSTSTSGASSSSPTTIPRVEILQPGPGVGGHCLAVDSWFIVDPAPEQARLIRTAREVNDAKPDCVIRRVRLEADRIKDPVIACFGIAYKADIDDLRESPALEITQALAESGCGEVLVVEPNATQLPARLHEADPRLVTVEEALQRADVVVGLVRHRAFTKIEAVDLVEKVVHDTQGMWQCRAVGLVPACAAELQLHSVAFENQARVR